MPQPQLRHQSGFNDVQMLQRHIMFKQLQQLQRRSQLQELHDEKQQNYINQSSAINKQADEGQFPNAINGAPIRDASRMFMVGNMSLMQRGTSPAVQGFSNGLVYSQAQSQALLPQQLDVSLYGTPIASARNNSSQYSHLQGISHDSTDVLSKLSDIQGKPAMQSSAFSHSFPGDQGNISSDLHFMPDGAFMSKQAVQGKDLFGQAPIQGLNCGVLPENFQQVNTFQTSQQELTGRQEQAGWSGLFMGKATQVGPSQGLATLDPLEEKILFNMDDNSWDAPFARCSDMSMDAFGSKLEHIDYLSPFPSIQSGSWSALMQSAVAEASSSDTALQEEWSGLSFQNTELSTDNQPSNFVDSGKRQIGWVDNDVQSAFSLNSKSLFSDSNMSSVIPALPQSDIQFSMKRREGIHSDSSHESIERSAKDASKWSACDSQQKQITEEGQPGQALQSLENAWSGYYEPSETDAHKQGITSYRNYNPSCNKIIGENIESLSPGGYAMQKVCDNENTMNKFWAGDNGAVYKEKDHDSCLWSTEYNRVACPLSNLVDESEQLNSCAGNKFVGREDLQLNKFDQETIRHTSESHQLDYVKHMGNHVKKKENESMGDDQRRQGNSSQVLVNSYEGASETIEKLQNCYQRENSIDGYSSNKFQHVITGSELRKNLWLRESDSQHLSGGNQNSSFQDTQGSSGEGQAYFGQLRFSGNVPHSAMDSEKGCSPEVQRKSKVLEHPPRDEAGANSSASFHRSVGFYLPNPNTADRSQNTLELLRKVDNNWEHSPVTHSTDSNPLSELPEAEIRESSVAQLYDHSSASQRFGSRLSHLSQQLSNSCSSFSSEISPKVVSAASPSVPPYLRKQLQKQHLPAAQAALPAVANGCQQYNPATSEDPSHMICTNPSGQQFPILEAMPVMSQQIGFPTKPSGVWTNVSTQQHVSGTELCNVPSSLLLSTDSTNNNSPWISQNRQDQNSSKGETASLEFGACSMNLQGFNSQQEQPGKGRSQQQILSEIVDPASQTTGSSHVQEYVGKHLSQANSIGSSSLIACSPQQHIDQAQHGNSQTQAGWERDLEAFGRSLKPSHFHHQNYSLLSQVHSVKTMETDPNMRISDKHIRAGPELNLQHVTSAAGPPSMYGHNSGVKNTFNDKQIAASLLNSFPNRDIKMPNLSAVIENQSVKDLAQHILHNAPQEMVPFSRGYSQSLPNSPNVNVASTRAELSQNSLQMAPSWFKHYGNLRNGQMLPAYDARPAKTDAQSLLLGKPFESLHVNTSMVGINAADASLVSSVWPLTPTTMISSKHTLHNVLPLGVADQNLAVMRRKKRKIATPGLLSWHKEVTQGSQRLKSISMAELEWAEAATRRIEKVEDEAEMSVDFRPILRPKKRLMLATQLMQQVFRPAPAAILSTEATLNYDSVTYFASRLVLGDACCLTSCTRSDSHLSSDTCNIMSEEPKTSGSHDEQYFSKIVEDFTNRAKKLEIDSSRFDNTTSILDIRLESQELEKFSIINRFAKFHSRSQAISAETSSSSGTKTVPKTFPERYVIAHPMPKTVPEGAQCLSL